MAQQELADLFSGLSADIVSIRNNQQTNLPADQSATLDNIASSLMHLSNQFDVQPVVATLAQPSVDAHQVVTTIATAQRAVKANTQIGKVISIGTAAVSLGTAIVFGDLTHIVSAVANVADAASFATLPGDEPTPPR